MSTNGTLITAQNLAVGWQSKACALIEQMQIETGKITVLAGPNGAGKSTVLKCLARQIRPLSGSIKIDADEIWHLNARQFAQKVAYVPQQIDQLRKLTVMEWVSLGRNPHQSWWNWTSNDRDKEAVIAALNKTTSWDLRDKFMDGLSGGERQRVLIATALAQEPRFLLLDEPTAHLDFRHQLELVSVLKELKEHDLGVLIVLHDLNLISRLADNVVLLHAQNGEPSQIAASGPANQVLTPETLRTVYEVEVCVLHDKKNNLTSYVPNGITNK